MRPSVFLSILPFAAIKVVVNPKLVAECLVVCGYIFKISTCRGVGLCAIPLLLICFWLFFFVVVWGFTIRGYCGREVFLNSKVLNWSRGRLEALKAALYVTSAPTVAKSLVRHRRWSAKLPIFSALPIVANLPEKITSYFLVWVELVYAEGLGGSSDSYSTSFFGNGRLILTVW